MNPENKHSSGVLRGSESTIGTIKRVSVLGKALAISNPDIGILYESQSRRAIAEMVIPEIAQSHAKFAEAVVGRAVMLLLSPEKRAEINKKKFAASHSRMREGLSMEEYSARQAAAARSRKFTSAKPLFESRGLTAWTNYEVAEVLKMTHAPEYLQKNGSPDYEKIKDALNKNFHNGDRIRTRNAVKKLYYRMRNSAVLE